MEHFESKITLINTDNKWLDMFYESDMKPIGKVHICTISLNNNHVRLHCENDEHTKLIITVLQLVANIIAEKAGL